jgi:hypothetical protein
MDNSYFIAQKINTVVSLFSDEKCGGFDISCYDENDEYNHKAGGLVISKLLSAENFHIASKKFISELLPVLDLLSVIKQGYVSSIMTPIMIMKRNKNSDNIIFLHIACDTMGTGLHFDGKNDDYDLNQLNRQEILPALHFFREANNANTLSNRALNLFIATEALAGTKNIDIKCKKCGLSAYRPGTDKEKMIEILGAKLADTIFYKKHSLRPKLMHGNRIEEGVLVDICKKVHNKLIDYLIKSYDLKGMTKIENAPRSIYCAEIGKTFIKCKQEFSNLKELNEEIYRMLINSELEDEKYEIITDPDKQEKLFNSY